MESGRNKTPSRPWHRGFLCCRCCPAYVYFLSTTKTAAAPETSETAVRMNSNGDVIMTQPLRSNGHIAHYANGIPANGIPARGPEKALRRLGVQVSQDRDFDEIDLGDGPTTHTEPTKRSQRDSTKELNHLEARQKDETNNRTSSVSTSGSTSGVSTMASSKPQSVKSNNTDDDGRRSDDTTRQLTDMMLSDVINERFDAADELPQIIEEVFTNVEPNVITEATAEEVKSEMQRNDHSNSASSSETSPIASSRTPPASASSLTINFLNQLTDSKEIADHSAPSTADAVLAKIKELRRMDSTSSEDTDCAPPSKSTDNNSDTEPLPQVNVAAPLSNVQQYGGFYESVPTSRMYADLEEEEDNSEASDVSAIQKEILTVGAVGAVGANKQTDDPYEKLENDSDASERPPENPDKNQLSKQTAQ